MKGSFRCSFVGIFTRSATLNPEKSPSASVHTAVSSGQGAPQKCNTPRLEVGPRNIYTPVDLSTEQSQPQG